MAQQWRHHCLCSYIFFILLELVNQDVCDLAVCCDSLLLHFLAHHHAEVSQTCSRLLCSLFWHLMTLFLEPAKPKGGEERQSEEKKRKERKEKRRKKKRRKRESHYGSIEISFCFRPTLFTTMSFLRVFMTG